MGAKRSAGWKSSFSRVCDNISFTIETTKGLMWRLFLFALELIGLWTILSYHLHSH